MSEYNTVAAYFPTQASAESAIEALKTAGFQQTQIGVAAANGTAGTRCEAAAEGLFTVVSAGYTD
jgi:hypothetical protein